jgi:hypothetical protein
MQARSERRSERVLVACASDWREVGAADSEGADAGEVVPRRLGETAVDSEARAENSLSDFVLREGTMKRAGWCSAQRSSHGFTNDGTKSSPLARPLLGFQLVQDDRVALAVFDDRHATHGDGMKEFGFHGEFKEVDAPAKLVHSEYYDAGDVGGDMGEAAQVRLAFTEDRGVTTVTTVMDFGNKRARDAAVATGMTEGMEQSYQLLDDVLAKR